MASNYTFVCFPCRYTRKAGWGAPKCPQCRNPLRNTGKRFPVPSKDDARGWLKAEAELNRIEATNVEWTTPGRSKRQEVQKILAARPR